MQRKAASLCDITMCLESREQSRRRRAALPMLHIQSNSASSSLDAECQPTILAQMPRNSMPEIFTFDAESVQAVSMKASRRGTLGARGRKPRRVLYPPKPRMHLPPPETDRPLRWLYILCLLVFVQICCEEATPDTQLMPLEVVMPNVQKLDLPVPSGSEVPFGNYIQTQNTTQEVNYTQEAGHNHADALTHNDTYSQGDHYSLTALFNDTTLSGHYLQR